MNIFLCGQKSFGAAVLERLISDGHNIVGVASPPQNKYYDKIYISAIKHNIKNRVITKGVFKSDIPTGTDLIIAAHSHQIISSSVIGSARYGAFGFHPSALPRHRGRDSVKWTIKMRDCITAGTVYKLSDKVDSGDILLQRFFHVSDKWDYHDLWSKMFSVGVDMLSEAAAIIDSGGYYLTEQDDRFSTWEPAIESYRLHRPGLIQITAET